MMTEVKEMKKLSFPSFLLSKAAVLLAVYGAATGNDIWLAPTQWMLVAILLGVWAIYTKLL